MDGSFPPPEPSDPSEVGVAEVDVVKPAQYTLLDPAEVRGETLHPS